MGKAKTEIAASIKQAADKAGGLVLTALGVAAAALIVAVVALVLAVKSPRMRVA